jgi:L-rhamnose-H+ transport protein
MNPLTGILLIAIGSVGAASFYVPFKKVKDWAWESYWLSHGVAAWLIMPWLFALFTVPQGQLWTILSESPSSAKWLAIFFGSMWGVGGLTFGLSLRYLGIAMGQSVALGFCAAFGTLIPPLFAGVNLLATQAGLLTLAGVSLTITGIAIIGYAGHLRNQQLSEEEKRRAIKDFALKKGLLIAILAGVMSAGMAYGFEAAMPVEELAVANGVNPLFASNPSLIFILLGGFATNLVYCGFLNIKNKTYRDYISSPPAILFNNIGFTFLAGTLWFLQFHFYGMGRSQLPPEMIAFAWSILMALNIAFSNIWGLALREWHGTGRKTIIVLLAGIAVLILSTFVVGLN